MKKFTFSIYCFLLSFGLSAHGTEWAKSQTNSSGNDVVADGNENTYVYGSILSNAVFGTQTFDPANGQGFLAKYNSTGDLQWVLQLDSVDIGDMVCDNSHVYIAARFGPDAHIGSTAITGGSNWDALMAKIDGAGNIVFVRTGSSTSNTEMGHSVCVDNSGNIYFTGYFSGATASFGSTTYSGNYGLETMFLIKYDPSGTIVWGKTVTSDDGSCTGELVRVNSLTGDVYLIAETFGDSLYFDAMYFFAGSYPVEVAVKYNASGVATNMYTANTGYQIIVRDAELDAAGNMYLLETNYNMEYSLTRLDPNLAFLWEVTDGGGGYVSPTSLDIDMMQNPIIAGFFGDNIMISGNPLSAPASTHNSFFVHYNAGGIVTEIKELEGNIDLRSISISDSDNIYMTGAFTDNAYFDTITISSGGGEAMFLVKYGMSASVAVMSPAAPENIALYPNPGTGLFSCELSGGAEEAVIEIYTMLGEKVKEERRKGGNMLLIDLTNEKKGTYVLKITLDNAVQRQRVIIQ